MRELEDALDRKVWWSFAVSLHDIMGTRRGFCVRSMKDSNTGEWDGMAILTEGNFDLVAVVMWEESGEIWDYMEGVMCGGS